MTDVIRMKKGDVFTFQHQLRWSDNTPMKLTSAKSVTLKMVKDGCSEYVVDDEMEVLDGPNGVVYRMWQEDEVQETGMFQVEFVVEFADGSILTVPSADVLWLWIMEGI